MSTVRIVSDGTAAGTKVFDLSGHEIAGIYSVSWSINASTRIASATIEFSPVEVEVTGEANDE